jgi:hypothetical protein
MTQSNLWQRRQRPSSLTAIALDTPTSLDVRHARIPKLPLQSERKVFRSLLRFTGQSWRDPAGMAIQASPMTT